MLVLDYGACKGALFPRWHNIANEKFEGVHIHAFEPHSPNYTYLFSYFGSKENITLNKVALGGREGKIKLYRNREVEHAGYQGASILEDKENVTCQHEVVDMIKLSDYWNEHIGDKDIDIVKMDIEGAEYDVLDDLIENDMINRIKHLIIEWHGDKGIPSIRDRHSAFLPMFTEIYKGQYTKWH